MKEISWEKYDENIKFYEVYKDNKFISYFIGDYFYNPNKRSWAWADLLRSKDEIQKQEKIVINVCNFTKSQNWATLLTLLEVETMFHEFWHAIHEMLSVSKYGDLSWFNVEWDFVELPSQLLENWCNDYDAIKIIWKHFETSEKIPDNYLDSLEKLKTYWSWNYTVKQNENALLDMFLHMQEIPKNIEDLDTKSLKLAKSLWVFDIDYDYKMYTSFSHIFDWAYSAWYYSYMWAEIIEADIFAEFKKNWIFDKETSTKFLNTILWQGSRKDASELFKDFMWRNVDIKAFFERKWF
jgi:Zn-dependent oligopeptidase